MKPIKPINLDYLEKVQKYCDSRAYQKEYGYNEAEAQFDDTKLGRIGLQLSVISAAIEEIFETYDSMFDGIVKAE